MSTKSWDTMEGAELDAAVTAEGGDPERIALRAQLAAAIARAEEAERKSTRRLRLTARRWRSTGGRSGLKRRCGRHTRLPSRRRQSMWNRNAWCWLLIGGGFSPEIRA